MQDVSDMDLLRQYAHRNSEEAFAALVTRHVNLVYSAALRKMGNPHAAEEITQAVFIILAKKADRLRDGTILSGWLYQTARLTAANYLRNEIRRAHREQEAYMQSLQNETEPNLWSQIVPHLEDAIGQLGEKDRNAIALRFFEGKSFQEVGAVVGVSENAAKKRVQHALEKLRKFFARRGIASTTAIIAGVISANSVQGAPATLATTISAAAMAKGAAASSSTLTLVKGTLKLMAWTKMKTAALIGVAVLLTTGTTALVIQQEHRASTTSPATGGIEFPKAAWTFSGYADPQSAFISAMWARSKPDHKIFLESLTSEQAQKEREDIRRQMISTRKSEDEVVAQIAKKDFAKITGIRVLNQEKVSDSQVILHLLIEGDHVMEGSDQRVNAKINKVGDDWKFDGWIEKAGGHR